MMRAACIITSYNRPHLVRDAIESVLEQSMPTQLIVMDDGSEVETLDAIDAVLKERKVNAVYSSKRGGLGLGIPLWGIMGCRAVVWQGRRRNAEERLSTCAYSRTINFGLNYLLADTVEYVCYLTDDDYLYPEAVESRVAWLDAHPEDHVAYGRLRALHFGADGRMNQWGDAGKATPGRSYAYPTGERRILDSGRRQAEFQSPATFLVPPEGDPEQYCFGYVDEGFWQPGPMSYGNPYSVDHNQVLHRRTCLDGDTWPDGAELGGKEYWPEQLGTGLGDCGFFERLGAMHPFVGVDAWCVTKRYHVHGSGHFKGEVRE